MRDSITVNAALNEIRLHASHPQNRDVVFILVEGDSDIRLFRSLFNQDKCRVKAIPGGNLKLEYGLSLLYQENLQVIGIRDADFMHLEGKTSQISILFLTDSHDIETMMLASDTVFKSVVNEFYNDIFSVSELRNAFFDSIQFLGYFRWYNNLNNVELNFNDVGIGDFFDPEKLKLDEARCIQNVVSRSPNCNCKDVQVILNEVNALIKPEHDLFQVCSGHDIASVMAIYFNYHKSGIKGLNRDRIQSQFRTAYNNDQFQNTLLFKLLTEWALTNKFNLF